MSKITEVSLGYCDQGYISYVTRWDKDSKTFSIRFADDYSSERDAKGIQIVLDDGSFGQFSDGDLQRITKVLRQIMTTGDYNGI